jgi:hypothetical protein
MTATAATTSITVKPLVFEGCRIFWFSILMLVVIEKSTEKLPLGISGERQELRQCCPPAL